MKIEPFRCHEHSILSMCNIVFKETSNIANLRKYKTCFVYGKQMFKLYSCLGKCHSLAFLLHSDFTNTNCIVKLKIYMKRVNR